MRDFQDTARGGYRSLLVHLRPRGDNTPVLRIAGKLADLFGARLIGIGAAELPDILSDEGTAIRAASTRDRAMIEEDLARCAADFQSSLQGRGRGLEWRSSVSFQAAADYVAAQARCADLVVTGATSDGFDEARPADVGRLAVKAGRPLLLVPESAPALALNKAVVAWKDTREARRAISDALPFLQRADEVTLLSVVGEKQCSEVEKQLKDVGQWLDGHGVRSEQAVVSTMASQSGYLHAELLSRRCDFVVAGAYGHTRLDEWVFGGVTRDVLLKAENLTLVSH
jgi:nucleotide-binding universal stress UspA family protein